MVAGDAGEGREGLLRLGVLRHGAARQAPLAVEPRTQIDASLVVSGVLPRICCCVRYRGDCVLLAGDLFLPAA